MLRDLRLRAPKLLRSLTCYTLLSALKRDGGCGVGRYETANPVFVIHLRQEWPKHGRTLCNVRHPVHVAGARNPDRVENLRRAKECLRQAHEERDANDH